MSHMELFWTVNVAHRKNISQSLFTNELNTESLYVRSMHLNTYAIAQLLKNFPSLFETQRFISMFKKPVTGSYLKSNQSCS
jgi:hypothetical protein